MLELRLSGWSTSALAQYYGTRDQRAILYQCTKYGIPRRIPLTVTHRPVRKLLPINIISYILDTVYQLEKVNPGKTYKEYLEDERKRKKIRLHTKRA